MVRGDDAGPSSRRPLRLAVSCDRFGKELLDRAITPLCGMLARSHAILVRNAGISSVIEQQLDDALVGGPAVA